MHTILISIISIFLFQGILVLLSGVSTVFIELNNGFLSFVDLLSKATSIAVFIWAVHVFILQQKAKKDDSKSLRIKELSHRLIDYVGHSNYSLNKKSANILITYLEEIQKECLETGSTNEQQKEYKLALNIVFEMLKKTTLSEVLNISAKSDYHSVINKLESIYSNKEELEVFDPELLTYIKSKNGKSTNLSINVPSYGLQLWQIRKILTLVFDKEADEVEEELSRGINSILDSHHHFPVLYGVYRFFDIGKFHITKEGEFTFSLSNLLMACDR